MRRLNRTQFVDTLSQIFVDDYEDLVAVAMDILHVRADAEDAVSDVFARLLRRSKKRRFKDGNLKEYLVQCIKYSAIDVYNARKKHDDAVHEFRRDSGHDIFSLVKSKMGVEVIIDLLDSVRPQSSAVVWRLRHLEGMSYKAIQKDLCLTQNQVQHWIYVANKQMKVLIANSDELKELVADE